MNSSVQHTIRPVRPYHHSVRRKRHWFRHTIGIAIAVALLVFNYTPLGISLGHLPNRISLSEGQRALLALPSSLFQVEIQKITPASESWDERLGSAEDNFSVAHDSNGFWLTANERGQAIAQVSLLGLPVKSIEMDVSQEKYLIPGGHSVGVMMYTSGALVVGTTGIVDVNGTRQYPAEEAGILPGDTILYVAGVEVQNAEHLAQLINSQPVGAITLQVSRDGKNKQLQMTPVCDSDNVYRLGMWVRDSSAGIGTLTYFDPSTGQFGALGHGITDVDTGKLLSLREGRVVHSNVVDIVQSKRGSPGELKGVFVNDQPPLGTLTGNTPHGVFGIAGDNLSNPLYDAVPIAHAGSVHTGPATILSTVNSQGIAAYEVEIQQVRPDRDRSLVIKVTDPKLLELTGGIVQGMSGSPIIQDGCIIGAVTHVFVNDPTKGYGVFIEQMLNAQ